MGGLLLWFDGIVTADPARPGNRIRSHRLHAVYSFFEHEIKL
jgi:hypothetical protein